MTSVLKALAVIAIIAITLATYLYRGKACHLLVEKSPREIGL